MIIRFLYSYLLVLCILLTLVHMLSGDFIFAFTTLGTVILMFYIKFRVKATLIQTDVEDTQKEV